MKSKSLAIAFVVLMLGTMPLYAAVDAFIWFDGVAGESTDAKHRDWIELESFSAGPSLQAATAGGAAKLAQFHDFTFTRKYDASSPNLMKLSTSGKHFPTVTISCRKAGGDPHEYLDFKLENVMVFELPDGCGRDWRRKRPPARAPVPTAPRSVPTGSRSRFPRSPSCPRVREPRPSRRSRVRARSPAPRRPPLPQSPPPLHRRGSFVDTRTRPLLGFAHERLEPAGDGGLFD